jgi:hypothetical protein
MHVMEDSIEQDTTTILMDRLQTLAEQWLTLDKVRTHAHAEALRY